jgi:hypothetical protein
MPSHSKLQRIHIDEYNPMEHKRGRGAQSKDGFIYVRILIPEEKCACKNCEKNKTKTGRGRRLKCLHLKNNKLDFNSMPKRVSIRNVKFDPSYLGISGKQIQKNQFSKTDSRSYNKRRKSQNNKEIFNNWAKPHFMKIVSKLIEKYIPIIGIPVIFVIDNKNWTNTRDILKKYGDKVIIYAVNFDVKEDIEENITPSYYENHANAFTYKCYAHTLMKILIDKGIKVNIVHYDCMQIMMTLMEQNIFELVGQIVDKKHNDVIYTISDNNISQGKEFLKGYNFTNTWEELQNKYHFEDVKGYIDIYRDHQFKDIRKILRTKNKAPKGAGKTMFSRHVQYFSNKVKITINGTFGNVTISIITF